MKDLSEKILEDLKAMDGIKSLDDVTKIKLTIKTLKMSVSDSRVAKQNSLIKSAFLEGLSNAIDIFEGILKIK